MPFNFVEVNINRFLSERQSSLVICRSASLVGLHGGVASKLHCGNLNVTLKMFYAQKEIHMYTMHISRVCKLP